MSETLEHAAAMEASTQPLPENKTIPVAPYLQNRELSWLNFNLRVLDQGADKTVPLLERLNFISIFWSNLQEFFMVRVGSLTDLSLVKKSIIDAKSGMTPSQQLDAIYARCHELYPIQEATYEEVRAQLAAQGVNHVHPEELSQDQKEYLDVYIHHNVVPFLSPQIINARHPFPHLENGALYVIVRLNEEQGPKEGVSKKKGTKKKGKNTETEVVEENISKKNLGAEGVTFGLIPMPRQCERVIKLPGDGFQFVLLEEAIERVAPEIFFMYDVKHTNVICITRNADLDATESTDAQDEDYREHMKRILKKRARLAPVRLETRKPLSSTLEKVLLKRLNLKHHQVFTTQVPLDMSYTWGLASRLSEKQREQLTNTPFSPQWPATLDKNRRVMDQVQEKDILLNYPYESVEAFVQLLREAVTDPSVISIKITLYRLASQSHLAEALIAAAENGKEVTALFELRARFDESNNIEWSQRFEQAGCKVIYGFHDYKVHSKICCITRQTPDGLQHITQLGTGNYNEKTAKLYTDFCFITADPTFGRDAMEFFRNMALENISDNYDILRVAPLQIKQLILSHIDQQIELQKAGEPSGLFFKTNSITDKEIIEKIVEASQAGVPTLLFVRGISCIVPGIENYTDNVRVVSIVGRLLEHSRIYGFGPRESMKLFLSSADLMTRNMDNRIEIAWPVLNTSLKEEIFTYIDLCMSDTAKLRELLPDASYTHLGHFAKETAEGEIELFESQEYLIKHAQQMRLKAAENEVARQAEERRLAAEAKAHAQAEREAAMEAASKVASSMAVATAIDEKAGAPADAGDETTFTDSPTPATYTPTTAPSLAGTKPVTHKNTTTTNSVSTHTESQVNPVSVSPRTSVTKTQKKNPKLLVKFLSLFVKK